MVKAERILVKTIEQKVLGFIDQHKLILPEDRLLVALSGGPDSVFVLYFLNKYKNRYNLSLGAAHINHCLRGSNSDLDEDFCKDFTGSLKIDFFSSRVDVKGFAKDNRLSIEEAARHLRYNVLSDFAFRYNFNKVVTAHNMSDNAETVLLNLIKGTGLKGISGIPPLRENIIRPVLSLSKPEILEYLNCLKIDFRIDETNSSNDYERNYIRNVLLPGIKAKLNPSVELSILNSSENFRNSSEFIDSQIWAIISDVVDFSEEKIEIDLNKLCSLDPSVFGEVIKRAVEKTFSIEFSFKDLRKVRSLIGNQTGRMILLPGGVAVFRERDSLLVIPALSEEEFHPIRIRIGETRQINGEKKISIAERKDLPADFQSSRFHEVISADDPDEEFLLRRWKPGDKFIPLVMKTYKKISDFLSEQKIPASEKKKQLVLTNRDEIVWVPGFRIDDRYRITEKSKRILELWLE